MSKVTVRCKWYADEKFHEEEFHEDSLIEAKPSENLSFNVNFVSPAKLGAEEEPPAQK